MSAGTGRARGVLLLGSGTVLAALFGLLFQSLLAYHFGAGARTDAWFMSLNIYAFVGKLLMLSQVKSLALPAYRRLHVREPAAAARLERRLVMLLGVGAGGLSVLLVLGAPLLVDALAPGYEGELRELTVTLVRIRTPALAFLAVGTGGLVALESARRFGVTVAAQKVVPAALALALLAVVGDRYGMVGVGWIGLAGGVAGGLVALAALAPVLRGAASATASPEGARGADAELRAVGGQWVRFGGSNGATLVGEWAFRVAASLLPVGLFSAVLYGRMVHDLLHGAVNDSAQTVSLPRFAEAAAAPDGDVTPTGRVGRELRESLGTLGAANVPIAAFVAATAPWSVALLFGRGRFLEDGMLGAAAVSLQIFAVGFLVQGLNQLVFAAAFASGRGGLVNRVQIVGHLARAAALVPAVMAFSFAGLVGAQVAMNVLVLTLLLAASPAEWRLRPARALGALAGASGRGTLGATALVAAAWALAATRLPDPLTLGTVGRLAVLAGAAAAWFVAYTLLALRFRVEPVRRALDRLRPGAALLVLVVLVPGGAAAQAALGRPPPQTGGALLPADHWTRTMVELLEARGALAVGASSAGPLAGRGAERLLEAAGSQGAGALDLLRAEAGGTWAARVDAGAQSACGDAPQGGVFSAGVRLGGPSHRFFAHAEAEAGGGGARQALARGAVGVRVGSVALHLGRERVQLGGGAGGGLVLSAAAPLDGALLTTERPFRVGFLGSTSVTAGLFAARRYRAVQNPWFALLRAAVHPAEWLEVGVSRGALVGGRFAGGTVPWDPKSYGPDERSVSAGDVLGALVGRTSVFENQVAALDVRASLARAGIPALAYGEMALEDGSRSWGDPAVLAGVLLAPASPAPVALRYEYAAFGSSARWCAWCDTLPAFWYQHTRFQSGWRIGDEPLGHPLGGYGAQHLFGLTVLDPSARLVAELQGGTLRRERWNLLEDERPGRARWGRARVRYRWPSGLELRAEGTVEEGRAGWSARRVRVTAARVF